MSPNFVFTVVIIIIFVIVVVIIIVVVVVVVVIIIIIIIITTATIHPNNTAQHRLAVALKTGLVVCFIFCTQCFKLKVYLFSNNS